jgi:hypothetical protein
MTLRIFFLTVLCLFASLNTWAVDFLEREIVFSQAEIQTALAKNGPIQKNYGGVLMVSLKQAPNIELDGNDGRARITTSFDLGFMGSPPVPVNVTGRAGIRYDDKSKAFFLENAITDSVESLALPKEMESTARQAVTQFMANYFRTKPIYVLRSDGSPQEIAARWLLKSVRIEPGKVVATLSAI